jgi:hypothetical protein
MNEVPFSSFPFKFLAVRMALMREMMNDEDLL